MYMDDNIENQINEIGGKLEIIKSIMRALNSALFGTEELEQSDAYSMASLLEEKIDGIIKKHTELVNELKI